MWDKNITAAITADIKLKKWAAGRFDSKSLSDISLRIGAYYYPMSVGNANLSHGIISAGLSWTVGGGQLKYD